MGYHDDPCYNQKIRVQQQPIMQQKFHRKGTLFRRADCIRHSGQNTSGKVTALILLRPLLVFLLGPLWFLFFGFGGDSKCSEEFPEPVVSYFWSYVVRRGITPAVSDPVAIITNLVYLGNEVGRNAALILEGFKHSAVKAPVLNSLHCVICRLFQDRIDDSFCFRLDQLNQVVPHMRLEYGEQDDDG